MAIFIHMKVLPNDNLRLAIQYFVLDPIKAYRLNEIYTWAHFYDNRKLIQFNLWQ